MGLFQGRVDDRSIGGEPFKNHLSRFVRVFSLCKGLLWFVKVCCSQGRFRKPKT